MGDESCLTILKPQATKVIRVLVASGVTAKGATGILLPRSVLFQLLHQLSWVCALVLILSSSVRLVGVYPHATVTSPQASFVDPASPDFSLAFQLVGNCKTDRSPGR